MSVMGIKPNTKAFGDTQNNFKPTGASSEQEYTPDELKKMGGESVGEVLNKVSDPNWVDPSKKMRTVGNDKLDKDAFFKLMLAQLKNQDPTNPLKSHEMAAQLANFSSLEQMQNMNTTLTDMKNGQKPMEQFQAISLIGKSVAGDSSKLVRVKGDKEHDFRFSISDAAQEIEITLKNADGEVVKKYKLNNLKAGENKIVWNGEDERGNKAPTGEFYFSAEAKGANGKKLAVKTDFSGVITGINYTPEGPVLLVGKQTIRLKDVKNISDASLMKNDQNELVKNNLDLKNQNGIVDTKKEYESKDASKGAEEPAPNAQKLMSSVGMSTGMLDRLSKETAK